MSDVLNEENLKIEKEELEQAAIEILEMAKTPGWKRVVKIMQDNLELIDNILRGKAEGVIIKDLNELNRYQDQREHLQNLINLPNEFAQKLNKPEETSDDPYPQ